MRTSTATLVVLVMLSVAAVGAGFASRRSAESGCVNEADRRGLSSVGFSWSWTPPGTTCTFDGRVSVTRLFW